MRYIGILDVSSRNNFNLRYFALVRRELRCRGVRCAFGTGKKQKTDIWPRRKKNCRCLNGYL